jgi:copper chaperone NosL
MNRTANILCALVLWLSPVALSGCEDDQALGPPEIRCGRDVCAECGMIINEARFAAAITVDDAGTRERRLFDDVGDMLDHEIAHPDLKIVARYVHLYQDEGWTAAESAQYLLSEAVTTPMASGIIAFRDAASRDAAKTKNGGRSMTWAEAREARANQKRPGAGR